VNTLALLGGQPVYDRPFTPYNSMGEEEIAAVTRVARSGKLSAFIGAWGDDFDGGPEIKGFENAWAARFGCRHALTVNSNTSGLIAALGAVGVSPGDEVIVPPYSMSATVVAPLFYGGIPVFVDLEPDTFCLDPAKVRAAITPRTRAIIVVDLFGHPGALRELRQLADEKGIYLIEDAAQAPLATEFGRYAGTVGHIGVFSLNYHKHIHTGEGGMCCTDDDELALRLRAIRNHGENIVEPLKIADITNIVGFNLRMTELGAAIGIEQLKKIDRLVDARETIANRLTEATRGLPGLTPPLVRPDCRHVYYVWSARYDEVQTGVAREKVVAALAAEGLPVSQGYVEPLYWLPLFQQRKAIGRDGWPFTLTETTYERGLCPVVERLHEKELIEVHVCSHLFTEREQQAYVDGFQKVFSNLDALRKS
jgi:dTDP-4-amino-4,6-dideoxygalactose transaminase